MVNMTDMKVSYKPSIFECYSSEHLIREFCVHCYRRSCLAKDFTELALHGKVKCLQLRIDSTPVGSIHETCNKKLYISWSSDLSNSIG